MTDAQLDDLRRRIDAGESATIPQDTTLTANERHRKFYAGLRARIIYNYGGQCACCGETEFLFLQIDHVNGGGGKHRKSEGYSMVLRNLEKRGYPPRVVQILCANCHLAKSSGHVCPHKRETSND